MKYLYKYPQQEYPYRELVEKNRKRSREELEYELLDAGVFDQNRYFDVFVEYAKVDPEDLLIRISVHNRGPEEATLHLLPTLWFRNTWSCLPAPVAVQAPSSTRRGLWLTCKVLLSASDSLSALITASAILSWTLKKSASLRS